MKTAIRVSLFVVGLSIASGAAWAHHSVSAEFDVHQPITLTGKVTKLEWMNPHVYIYLDAKDELGHDAHFVIQGGAPNVLSRQGWTRNSLKPGDLVTVSGFKARDGWNRLNARDVTLSDGRKVFTGLTESSQNN